MERKILVKKAKKGDGEAFIKLIKQYEQVLYKVASRMLDNDEDVADAMQDAILLGYQKISTLKNEEYFNTWMCKILINACNGILNRNKKVILVDEVIAKKQTNSSFLKVEMDEALNSLNQKYKLAIILYYVVGFNTKEISELVKEPEGTIKSRISRAKDILRNSYFSIDGGIGYER